MTVRRSRAKSKVTDEMAADVALDLPEPDETVTREDADTRVPRRPQEPSLLAETKGRWERAEQFTRIFASLGVAVAAGLGFLEYKTSNDDVRRERSLELVRDWQQDKLIDRYTRIQTFVERKLETSDAPPEGLPPAALMQAYANLGYVWTAELRQSGDADGQRAEQDIDQLTLFFGQMEICISSGLCDAAVLRAYFESEVVTFWQYFSGYARLRHEANYSGYGAPVDQLVARFAEMDTKASAE